MQTLLGFDLSTPQKMIVASIVILVLLALLGLFVRSIKGGRLSLKGQGGGRTRQPRLGVVDMYDLDRQRQLVLIRRDNVEHLLMIGGVSDVVVETNILRSGARAPAPAPVEVTMPERALAQEPMLPGEPLRNDTPPAVDQLPPLPTRPMQPSPLVRPPQPQRPIEPPAAAAVAAAAAVVAAPAVAAALSRNDAAAPVDVPTPTVQPPSFARDHAPSPAASTIELDSMTRQLEEALKRPYSAVRSSQAPAETTVPPEPVKIEPAPVVPSATMPEPEPVDLMPEVEEAASLPVPTPPAPPITTGKPIPLPADVEAELEMALGLKPERAAPFVAPAKPLETIEPAALKEPELEPEPEPAEVAPDVVVTPPPEPESEPEPVDDDPVMADLDEPEPAPKEEATPEEPPVAEKPAPKPAAIDPFSVDAIEAEFARLLGRGPTKG